MKVLDVMKLKPFKEASKDELLHILSIRNQGPVRNNMYTDHIISDDEHLHWVETVKDSEVFKPFIVEIEDQIIGYVSASKINQKHKTCEWAFYLDSTISGRSYGSVLEYKFINFMFNELGVEKINCEVIDFNEPVVRLHKKFGFTEEGLRRNMVEKNGTRYGVVLLGITKGEWVVHKPVMMEKIERIEFGG